MTAAPGLVVFFNRQIDFGSDLVAVAFQRVQRVLQKML
jgi:hypothetical protein